MKITPEYEAALRGLKNGTLTRGAGSAENAYGQAYHRMVVDGLASPLRTKYTGRRYKSTGSKASASAGQKRKGRLGMNAPLNWGTGDPTKRQKGGS